MPVQCVSIRDASLTTRLRINNALSAFRVSYPPPGFPVGNAAVPEQFRNQVSAEVPLFAKQGTCGCDPANVIDPYGFRAPVLANYKQ